MITVMIVDDHIIVRQGIRALLEKHDDISVVFDTDDSAEAAEAAGKLNPNVAVVDFTMPKGDGAEVTKAIKSASPETKVLILSMSAFETDVRSALDAGASGYILKESTVDLLVNAIRQLVFGGICLGPGVLDGSALSARQAPARDAALETLTKRELEVLQLIAQGETNNTAAAKLSISSRTVEVHRANIHRKLGLHNQAEVIRYAIKNNLVSI